jgi:hypothetical protein
LLFWIGTAKQLALPLRGTVLVVQTRPFSIPLKSLACVRPPTPHFQTAAAATNRLPINRHLKEI